jgi:hypothetical protein
MAEKQEHPAQIHVDEAMESSPFPWTSTHLLKLNYCIFSLVLFGEL